ncbi:MAG: extracellular solute-binding protein [Thermoproteota archaeon]|jgi:iron(III) transport system substrate-binding protein
MSNDDNRRNLIIGLVVVLVLVAGIFTIGPNLGGQSATGDVLVYGSVDAEDLQPAIDAFEAKNPEANIEYVRGSPPEVYSRITTELEAGQKSADMVLLSFPGTLSLVDDGLTIAFSPSEASNYPDDLKDSNGHWYSVLLLGQVITYNTNLVSEDELPTQLSDLTDPKWNGMITMHDYSRGSTSTRIWATLAEGELGSDKVIQFLTDLEANVNPVLQRSTGAQVDEVVRGEYAIGIVGQLHDVVKAKMDGAPVEILHLEDFPVMWGPTAGVILESSANAEGAEAFINFLMSEEGQIIIGNVDVRFAALPDVAGEAKHTFDSALPDDTRTMRYPNDEARSNHGDWTAKFKEIAGA